jgi:hypothetical protein
MRLCVMLPVMWSLVILSLLGPAPAETQTSGVADIMETIEDTLMPSLVLIISYDDGNRVSNSQTGFFCTPQGHILTALGGIRNSPMVNVKTIDRGVFKVKRVMGEERAFNLVKLTADVPASQMKPVSYNRSMPVYGTQVYAVTIPGPDEKTVTALQVTGTREIPGIGTVILTTPSIPAYYNNCPVSDARGQVLGLAVSESSGGAAVDFIIPSAAILGLFAGATPVSFEDWGAREMLQGLDNTYAEAMRLLWLGRFAAAAPLFERAAKTRPQDADPLYYAAACYENIKQAARAQTLYEQALKADPESVKALFSLGLLHARAGRAKKATALFAEVVDREPRHAQGHAELVKLYAGAKNRDLMQKHLALLRGLDPDLAEDTLYEIESAGRARR